jgi:hypothetical protein
MKSSSHRKDPFRNSPKSPKVEDFVAGLTLDITFLSEGPIGYPVTREDARCCKSVIMGLRSLDSGLLRRSDFNTGVKSFLVAECGRKAYAEVHKL